MRTFPRISEIMTSHVITISPEDDLTFVEEAFTGNKIHHLPVVSAGKLVGIISKSDFLYFLHGAGTRFKEGVSITPEEHERLSHFKSKDIMTTGLATLEPDLRLDVVIEIFRQSKFHSLPIVEDGMLVGIVTTHDLINWMAKEFF